MKYLSLLPLLFLSVRAYSDCKNCRVVTIEEGVSWGVEDNDWCIIKSSLCDKNSNSNQCFSFPDYPCCNGCDVVEQDNDGKWGIENNE